MKARVGGTGTIVRAIMPVLFIGAVAGCGGSIVNNGNLTDNLSAPLGDATRAKVDINAGTGNLTIDRLAGGEAVLARGTLQYTSKQGVPTQSLDTTDGQATLTLRGQALKRSWFRLPWVACVGAYDWQIHLNPGVPSDIIAHSDGGNVKLNLSGMEITGLSADTGGGNVDVVLPDGAADLDVTAKTGGGNVTVEVGSAITGHNVLTAGSGAGNVVVHVPSGVAAEIHATSGLGKVIVDSQFSEVDTNTYRSTGYDGAVDRIEITVRSGAGDVSVSTR